MSFRYLYLHYYGGVYADLDTECTRSFESLLAKPLIFGGMEKKEWVPWNSNLSVIVQNSFMASVSGHPFWMEVRLQNPVRGM